MATNQTPPKQAMPEHWPGAKAVITLTKSHALYPASAVSGWCFAHPEAQYFNVGKIDKDWLSDYAQCKGIAEEVAARWLAAHVHH